MSNLGVTGQLSGAGQPQGIANGLGSVSVKANGTVLIVAPGGHLIQNGSVDLSHAGWGDTNFGFNSNLSENASQISALLVARLATPIAPYAGIVEGIDAAAWSYGNQNFTNSTVGLCGVGGSADIRGSGTVTGAAAFAAVLEGDGGGTATNFYGYFCYNGVLANGTTIGTQFGLYVQNLTAGANNVGVYVAGATTYAIWVAGGAVRFDGLFLPTQGIQLNPGSAHTATSYAILTTDCALIFDGTTNAITATLPTAVGVNGKLYFIKALAAATHNITLATTSAQTIDGAASLVLNVANQAVILMSDGANWKVMGQVATTIL